MKNFLLLSVLAVFIAGKVSAQDANSILKKMTPPSPDVASLGKFLETPVSLYTGVPSISIPIIELTAGKARLPVSIDYHAGGIRVDEIASSIGLGFSLNAGGIISKKVNGFPDFSYDQYPNFTALSPSFNPSPGSPDYDYAKHIAAGEVDIEPDDVFYNFAGHSGSLISTGAGFGQTFTAPFELLRVETGGFTDESGVKYYFGSYEISHVVIPPDVYNPNMDFSNNQTNKLTRITSPDGKWINLEYYSAAYSYKQARVQSDSHVLNNQYGCPLPGVNYLLPIDKESTVEISDDVYLKKISTSDGTTVDFIYDQSSMRKDLPGAWILTEIDVSANGVLLKRILLSHSFFGPNDPSGTSPEAYRLKLDAITEVGKPAYQFYYFGTSDTFLPPRNSFAQDYWGYFNGRTGNNTLLPKVIAPDLQIIDGANRDADPNFTQYCSLVKVKYPTGGTSEFEYEQNEYTIPPNVPTGKKIIAHGIGGNNSVNTDSPPVFTIPEHAVNLKLTLNSQCPPQGGGGATVFLTRADNPIKRASFFINETGPVVYPFYYADLGDIGKLAGSDYTLSFLIECPECCEGSYSAVLTWDVITDEIFPYATSAYTGGVRIKKIRTSAKGDNSDIMVKAYGYKDPQTDYSSGIVSKAPPQDYYIYTPSVVVQLQNPTVFNCKYVNRVNTSVTPTNSFSGSSICYEYVTELSGENGENGKILNKFSVLQDVATNASVPYTPYTSYDFLRGRLLEKTDFIKKPTGSFSKVHKTVNQYQIYHDPSSFWGFRSSTQPNETNLVGMKLVLASPEINSTTPVVGSGGSIVTFVPAQFDFSLFKKVSAWSFLKQSDEFVYDSANQDSYVQTTTNYFYDNPTHIQLTRVVETQSNGKVKTSFSSYPQDFTPGTGFIDNMVTSNELSYPIEQVSYQSDENGTRITEGKLFEYKAGGKALVDKTSYLENSGPVALSNFKFSNRSIGQIPHTSASSTFNPDSQYKLRLSYDTYDNLGNLTQVTVPGASPQGFHWAYNQKYLIAECKNAASDEFFSENFENVSGAASGAHTGRYSFSGSYTTSDKLSPGYHGRNYSISWWYLSGSQWVYSGEQAYTGQTLNGVIDDVRILPSDAQITTYTYDPMVGMTSSIDTKGMTSYYEYDSSQRLQYVKDQNGNVIKNNTYHYKN
ncbi:hypothetical protein QF042_000110 [Pedobacter sp. W3I1]|uniref:hypothetical protein n=1 Tax=Pedobacter sp. W3I1 TaxID=3042291 RepID=UPI0027884B3D|nr:hypothetical protein [Pedobacter sp. W3I1]MDQ0636545.1 hypothetical protein [Pedobacter sp. W3I1]